MFIMVRVFYSEGQRTRSEKRVVRCDNKEAHTAGVEEVAVG